MYIEAKKDRLLFPYVFLLFEFILIGCVDNSTESTEQVKIFEAVPSTISGLDFANILTENDTINYFTYSYLYMGGGIAVGDVNNDGLEDIYFTGNMVQNKLYLNRGNLQFEDITAKAGVGGDERWYTGVTMADVNADGFMDIYCSVSGKDGNKANQFFLNDGDGTFKEVAQQLGIADLGQSVQATFFDYDKDGDLDLYVANYPMTRFDAPTYFYRYKMNNPKDLESNQLYRNDGDSFTKVTKEAGLLDFGLSLSATVADVNNDSWPDIYVSNDFNAPDFLYLNKGNGTFKESVADATGHTAFYGMGVDIADANNDGHLDIFQVDMDANNNRRKKANMASMNIPLFWDVVNAGFHYQYMHNCFQLNSGIYENGVPKFSNVSRLTGTSSTDWSWGPLFADFDNDGLKDLFVSNGTRREVNNNDFFKKIKKMQLKKDTLLALSKAIPSEKIDNFMFKNQGNLSYEIANKEWGISYEGFSNGVVYVDLDNDGDLEVLTNNIDDKVSLFQNNSAKTNNYFQIKLIGKGKNHQGIGARVQIETEAGIQMQELTLTRGFQSSVSPILHFGLANQLTIKNLKVMWPSGASQVLSNIKANQRLQLNETDAIFENVQLPYQEYQFTTDQQTFPEHKHEENYYDDFNQQVLLPHKMSAFGPALAKGDLNGDGLEDYFVGGAAGKTGAVYIQNKSGFESMPISALEQDAPSEDVAAIIFDADQDGDNDLYVVSGGYEFKKEDPLLADRLYLNREGTFVKADTTLLNSPSISGSQAYIADFNKDDKLDILVLGRQTPGNYPSPASSYILMNKSSKNEIKFETDLSKQPKEFDNMGMATSAVVTDYDNDGWQDIIVVGEWMPIRVFKNTKGSFKEVSEELGLGKETAGWWWSIAQGDFDNDGDMDYVLGNNGLNYKYKANKEETFDIYVNDFDKNEQNDIVLSYYNDGEQYPVRGRECSSQQIPAIKQKFKDYESFSQASLIDVYTEADLEKSLHYQVHSFASIYLENKNGKFIVHQLPREAQLSNITSIIVDDFNTDGNLDLIIAGNLFVSEVETPRNDAGYGLYLRGDGTGKFKPIPAHKSGLFIPGDVKQMIAIKAKGADYLLAAKNNDHVQGIKIQ